MGARDGPINGCSYFQLTPLFTISYHNETRSIRQWHTPIYRHMTPFAQFYVPIYEQ